MEDLKLSIIIPMYNGKKYIRETVQELLKIQSNKEIIIIDDGSVDGSYDFCKRLWENNSEIRIITKKNEGIVSTRNYGLDIAKGKYLLFVDQDDIVFPNVVDEAIDITNQNDLEGMIWSTARLVDNHKFIPCDTVYNNGIMYKNEINEKLIPSMLINTKNNSISYLGHVWAGIYKRSFVIEKLIRFKRFVDIEDDYLFVFDFLVFASSVGLMKEVGYAWRYNRESETYRQKYIENILYKYMKLYDYLLSRVSNDKLPLELKERFRAYQVQNTLVMTIENSFTYLNNHKNEKIEIKRYYLNNRKHFIDKSIYPYEKRRKRIYLCLHHGLFRVSGFYVYIDSIYRKIRTIM